MESTHVEEEKYELPNVAAVPQLSPFRYPGGKSRWYNLIRRWVEHTTPTKFVEPFAGGAHAGLIVAYKDWGRRIVDQVVLVELDKNVAAVWKTIFSDDVEWLIERIEEFEMSREAAEEVIERKDNSTKARAFAMIVHNRVSRGGVTAPGAGWLNNGENGQGLTSRWYPSTLIDRIKKIAKVSDRVEFEKGDALKEMSNFQDEDCAQFIDPPYPGAGRRLYEHSDVDHEQIFDLASESEGPVLMTYDNSDEVKQLVEKYDFSTKEVEVSTTHHRDKTELLISDDLQWLKGMGKDL